MTGLLAEVRPYCLALTTPLQTARGPVYHRSGLLFGVLDGGLVGWGEATPMPGWSETDLPSTAEALAAAAAGLSAIARLDDPRLDDILDDLEPMPHARAALASALADLTARRAGLPVATTLSDSPALSVQVNALASGSTPEVVAEECAAAVAAGYETVKLKVGVADPAVDRDRVAAARATLGPDLGLRVDANGAWDIDTAVTVLDQLADHDVMWCEEPSEGIDAIAQVGTRSAIPVAVDESARTMDDVARALGTRTIDVVVVKPQALGGPDLAMRAVRLATEFGSTAVVTSMVEGAVGVAHALHVAAASGVELAHGLGTSEWIEHDLAEPLPVVGGSMALPMTPGIGVEPFATLPDSIRPLPDPPS